MEGSILLFLQAIRIDGLMQVLVLLSSFSNMALLWLIVGVVFIFQGRRDQGLLLIVTMIVVGILGNVIISNIIGRPRPCDAVIGLAPVMGIVHDGGSLPNFHAATGFAAAYLIMKFTGRRFGMPAYIYAALNALVQAYFGVAYLTDILAGAVFGTAMAIVTTILFNRFFGSIEGAVVGRMNRGRRRRRLRH